MRRTTLCWLLPAVLSLGCTVTALSADTARVIRLRADSWMPYNGDPAAPLPGYAVEVARAIFEPQGYTVDYQTMPWADAVKAATADEVEGVIGANEVEAPTLVIPRQKIGVPVFGLFVRKGSTWTFDSVASLAKVKLGVVEGYSYWQSLDAYVSRPHATQVVVLAGATPLLDGIGQLDRGELDVLAESKSVWLWSIKSSGRSNKDYHSVYLHPGEPIYIAFAPRQGKELAKLFDEGMVKLRASGRLAAILMKYSLPDWQ